MLRLNNRLGQTPKRLGQRRSNTRIVIPQLRNVSAHALGTVASEDVSRDGTDWAQSSQQGTIYKDPNGKLIVMLQRNNGGSKYNVFCWSNDNGATWQDCATTEAFLERISFCVDETHDIIHTACLALDTSSSGGLIVRQWGIDRDVDGNITGLTRVSTGTVNTQVDYARTGITYAIQHPVLLHCTDVAFGTYGALVLIYTVYNASAGKGEIRALRCILGASATASGNIANWGDLGVVATDTIANAPQSAYTVILAHSNAGAAYCSAARRANGDLVIAYHTGVVGGSWRYVKLLWDSVNHDWRTGLANDTLIVNMIRAGASDLGYEPKRQLGTCPIFISSIMYFAFSTWANGDTWTIAKVDLTTNTVTLCDVYNTNNAAHDTTLPETTGDLMYDTITGYLVASYTKYTTLNAYAIPINKTTLALGTEALVLASRRYDIPLICPTRVNNKLCFIARDDEGPNSPPFKTYIATCDLN